jgi:hypothetical protein
MPLPEGFQKWADTHFPKLTSQQSVLAEQMSLAADRMREQIPHQKDESNGATDDEWGDGGKKEAPTDPAQDKAEEEFKKLVAEGKVAPKDFETAYNRIKPRVDFILNYPAGYASDAIKNEQKAVKELHDKVTTSKQGNDLKAGAQSLDKLLGAVKSANKALVPHDKEMRAYYKELKALQPRIDYAKTIHGKSDMATKPWKTEAEAFHTKKGEVVTAQNGRLYKDARARLGELKTSIDALMDKRLASLATAKSDSTTTASKTKDYVDQLEEAEVSYLPSEEQVALLNTLRTKRPSGTLSNDDELKTRCKILRNMKLNPEFEKQDKKNRSEVVKKLLASPKFAEAEKNWSDWSKTTEGVEKQKAFLLEAAKLQCEVLGNPMPTIVFNRQRSCKKSSSTIAKHGDHDQATTGCTTCNGVLPGSTTFRKGTPVAPPCNHCGNTDYSLFGFSEGACSSPPNGKPGTPASIDINTVPESSFGDFQEVLDSLMHENTHAYQMSLVYDRLGVPPLTAPPTPAPDPSDPGYAKYVKDKKIWDNRLKPSDGDLYKQAMMFYENELAYVGPDASKAVDGGLTYRKEPLEDHAWSFGPAVARQALIQRKRDLDSKQSLKEEYIEIEGVQKTRPIVVKLKARHGLDKGAKVVVSGVEGMTQINGKTFSVTKANSQFELWLDGDGRSWSTYTKGGRVYVETKSDDLG